MNTAYPSESASRLKCTLESMKDGVRLASYAGQRAHVMDMYFHERTAELFAKGLSIPGQWALLAVGGYGRGELCPGSDVDAVLVFPDKIPQEAEAVVAGYFHPLWDVGLKVGHGVRSVADCLGLASKDHKVFSSLLDVRLLSGDGSVVRRVRQGMEAVGKNRRKAFAKWLAAEIPQSDDTVMLEPDLKNGSGGLRDAQRVFWLAALFQDADKMPFPADALARLREDTAFLMRVRVALHLSQRRASDRLSFGLQRGVAERLGFVVADDSRAAAGREVEFFLSRLHRTMENIRAMRKSALRAVLGGRKPDFFAKLPPGVVSTTAGLHSSRRLDSDVALNLFLAQAQTRVPLAWSARDALMKRFSSGLVSCEKNEKVIDRFVEILGEHGGSSTLMAMAETGFLSVLFPQFSDIQYLVQFNDYHVHPAGRHTVRTVSEVGKFLEGDEECSVDAEGRRILLLAAFFHDFGKGVEEGDHSREGAGMVRQILGEYGCEASEIDEVAFLVRQHLLLPVTALKQDISDARVVENVAAVVGTSERLERLYVLSVADARATGPRAWNQWTASLLLRLRNAVRDVLDTRKNTGKVDSFAPVREEILSGATEFMERSVAEALLRRMPAQLIRNQSVDETVLHLSMVRGLEAALEHDHQRRPSKSAGRGVNSVQAAECEDLGAGFYKVSIVMRDARHTFEIMTGALALHCMNVLSADVHTVLPEVGCRSAWTGPVALDVFIVRMPENSLLPAENWARVSRSIYHAFNDRLDIEGRLEARRRSLLTRKKGPDLPPKVRLVPDHSGRYSLVEVAAPDREGLLFDLARCMDRLGLDIRHARIASTGGMISDVFHVLREGRPLAGEEMAEVRHALIEAAG